MSYGAELEYRLRRLGCVSPITLEVSLENARLISAPHLLRMYLDCVLPFAERFVATVPEREFSELCRRLAGVTDFATLVRELGLDPEDGPDIWAKAHARWVASDHPAALRNALYCLGNHFALCHPGMHADAALTRTCVYGLALVLGLLHRYHESAGVIEFAFGWNPSDYANRELIADQLRAHTSGRPHAVRLGAMWSEQLRQAGRDSHAVEVILALLGVGGSGPPPEHVIVSAILGISDADPPAGRPDGVATPSIETLFLLTMAVAQLRLEYPSVVTAAVGQVAKRYAPRCSVGEWVGRLFDQEAVRCYAASLLTQVAFNALREFGGSAATQVVEEALGLTQGAYSDEARLVRAATRIRLARDRTDADLAVLCALVSGLNQCGRHSDAVEFFVAYFAPPGSSRFTRSLSGWQARYATAFDRSVAVRLIATVGMCLRDLRRKTDADELLHATLADLVWLHPIPGRPDPGTFNILIATQFILRHESDGFDQLKLDTCRGTIRAMRRSLSDARIPAEDRRRLQKDFRAIRAAVVGFGIDRLSRSDDPLVRERQWVEVLGWDAELGQRVVLERFLGAGLPAPTKVTDFPPLPSRPSQPLEADEPHHLAFDLRVADLPPLPVLGGAGPTGHTHTDADALASQLAKGITDADLAAGLGPTEKLLKAGFAPDGRLVWSVIAVEDRVLRVVADGIGQPGDRDRVATAAARHDAELGLLWQPTLYANRRNDYFVATDPIRNALTRLARALQFGVTGVAPLWQDVVERVAGEAGERLASAYAGFFDPPTEPAGWLQSRLEVVNRLTLLLLDRQNSVVWRTRMDAPTRAFVQAVAAVWPVERVAAALTDRDDLLVRADGPLHSVPISYLPCGHGYLFQCVASVRVVLSTVLNDWMSNRERSRPPSADAGAVVSWAGDAAEVGVRRLHAELDRVRGAWDWRLATGEAATLAGLRAITARPLRVAVVCGHGADTASAGGHPAGVRLWDGIWSGGRAYRQTSTGWLSEAGCDLSGVDLLIQVSCSVGRVRDGGEQDVDGFCVETAVTGGRSVLAGKWRIHVFESSAFAAAVVDAYRAAADNNPPAPCRRARAVTAARNACLTPDGPAGLNTTAAFDLYGLG